MYHIPVMLQQSVDGLNIKPEGTYVDVTFGGGGHSRAILEKLTTGRLIAFDQDDDALANVPNHSQFTLINHNFRFLKNFLRLHNAVPVDGILADLGISSHQIDEPERGFASRFNGPLDMRMGYQQPNTAANIVNEYSFEQLSSLIRTYGELKNSGKVASVIVKKRELKPITTTTELVEIIEPCFPANKRSKSLAMVFQALRIAVNDEMQALEELLMQTTDVLAPGGRLVVISYHSLEDRLVKNFIRSGNFKGELKKDFYGNIISDFKSLTGKPIVPDEEELSKNNRSRSAKLRIAEKI